MNQPTIQLKHLLIGYNHRGSQKVISAPIDATIQSGCLTCLLGENGAGKSTLLRTLSAFLPSLDGEILLMGRPIKEYTDKALSRLISIVLTERCEVEGMTVEELVGMGRSPYTGFWGRLDETDQQIIREAIDAVHITSLSHRLVHFLSDGERQKAMIAKALAQQTPIIFLDEPTAFLDFPSKVEIMQLLHRLTRTLGKTIFFSTHDLELALQIADCAWVMDRKKGLHIGTPEDLMLQGTLAYVFEREGIRFEIETGQFRVETEHTRTVHLVGHGRRYLMVRKALLRNGILGDRKTDSPTRIVVGEANDTFPFELYETETAPPRYAHSIEELLSFLQK